MTFRLRFSVRDIAGHAAAYPADDDRVAETDVAPTAKAAGTLSKSNPTNCLGTNFSLHACVKTAAACRDFSFGLIFRLFRRQSFACFVDIQGIERLADDLVDPELLDAPGRGCLQGSSRFALEAQRCPRLLTGEYHR